MVKLGEAVGIIAAQSIGRTRHAAHHAYVPRWRRPPSETFKQPIIKAKNDGTVRYNDLKVVKEIEG